MGDKFHPKLNISRMPIANKYREGKMKRTLKRELKGPEIAKGEAVERNFQLKTSLYLCKGELQQWRSMSIMIWLYCLVALFFGKTTSLVVRL